MQNLGTRLHATESVRFITEAGYKGSHLRISRRQILNTKFPTRGPSSRWLPGFRWPRLVLNINVGLDSFQAVRLISMYQESARAGYSPVGLHLEFIVNSDHPKDETAKAVGHGEG